MADGSRASGAALDQQTKQFAVLAARLDGLGVFDPLRARFFIDRTELPLLQWIALPRIETTFLFLLGDANVVIPISNMGFVAAFILSLMLKFERVTWRKLVAIPMAMASVIALTLSIG